MVFARNAVARYLIGMSSIKELREKAGLTQSQLAEMVDTSQPQIKRLESGERELTPAWAERLAQPLKTSAIELLFPGLGIPTDPVERLRAALLAYGVHPDDLSRIVKVIDGFVDDADDDERS